MSEGPLRILFATPECAPWVKTGGLGDVCGALPKALAQRGHDVRVLLPAFPVFAGLLQAPLETLALPAQGPWPAAHLHRVEAQGIQLWLLDVPSLYARPCGPYLDHAGQDYADNAERFGMLSHVAARLSHAGSPCADWPVDVLHCHDWTTGLAPAYLLEMAGRQARAATVMTIHNLLFQGLFPSHLAPWLDMPSTWLTVDPGLLHWDRLCFLKAGLRCADRITTVSPTYAREIQMPEQGCGLDGMLRLRSADLVGILNGIDTTQWDPARDPLIAQTYDADTLSRKLRNKVALRERLGLSQDDDRMLLGLVSRMTAQKGIDLLIEALPVILEMGCQLCVLGSGDKPLEEAMSALAIAHPGRVAVRIGFDEGLAHLIEAGADAFLMPSVFEPCGLNQLYSQAYGTPPIVHAVGGLSDSVQEHVSTGNGFAFDTPSADAFLSAVQRAHALYQQPQRWRQIQRTAMALDRSWGPSAQQYEAVYAAARLRAGH